MRNRFVAVGLLVTACTLSAGGPDESPADLPVALEEAIPASACVVPDAPVVDLPGTFRLVCADRRAFVEDGDFVGMSAMAVVLNSWTPDFLWSLSRHGAAGIEIAADGTFPAPTVGRDFVEWYAADAGRWASFQVGRAPDPESELRCASLAYSQDGANPERIDLACFVVTDDRRGMCAAHSLPHGSVEPGASVILSFLGTPEVAHVASVMARIGALPSVGSVTELSHGQVWAYELVLDPADPDPRAALVHEVCTLGEDIRLDRNTPIGALED